MSVKGLVSLGDSPVERAASRRGTSPLSYAKATDGCSSVHMSFAAMAIQSEEHKGSFRMTTSIECVARRRCRIAISCIEVDTDAAKCAGAGKLTYPCGRLRRCDETYQKCGIRVLYSAIPRGCGEK